ncbi:hypothetical protein [Pelosinus sp. UFO1]|uniref:hypothetical protein n=1 Tax=Pelosinus sp. UFO1 TaxID=484770 RepID=UPI0004D1AA0C|nr:hypothetical protein [Pelosinus sp. UFO1]AIF52521.1 hypothetical protein UFO1_2978 [Pelosinus sp. UFO1]
MNSIVKKGIICSMIGIMQLGIGTAVIEASPRHHENKDYEERYEHHKDRDHRIQEERERHEREMKRRHHEEEWQWHERQQREKEHHEEVMRTIGGLALLYLITNS